MIGAVALAVYLLARFLPTLNGLDRSGQTVLGIAGCGMVLWMSEAMPFGVTALLVLVLLGTTP